MSTSSTNDPQEQPPLSTPPAPPAPDSTSVFPLALELLREMREQRQSYEVSQQLAVKERTSERRWRTLFQAMFFGAPILFSILYFLFFLSSTGFRWGPFGDVVGKIRIEGPIGSGERASADNIIPILEKAFRNPSVKGIVLHIDSPGGSPVEAERISTAITSLKAKHDKEVVAVINNIGASAAYMIALNADKIVAAKYSFVGSVGAIMAPWALDKAIAKVDVSQRVYASGNLKAFLNPFTAVTPDVDRKAQLLVDQLGGYFVSEVKAKRGSKLNANFNVGTGEVWAGPEAKELGLVDAVSTVDVYVSTHWGIETFDYGPMPEGSNFLSRAFQDAAASAIRRLSISAPALQ